MVLEMANVTNTALGLRKRSGLRSRQGFSLVELMCVVAVVSVMASLAWPAVVGLVSGNRLTNNAYQLSGLVQQARATALAQHTYVWVGFYSYTGQDGAPSMMVATLSGNSGLTSDLQSNNYAMASKPAILKNVALASTGAYASLPGLDSTDNTDVASQSFTFHLNVPGYPNAPFSNVIVFGPDGQASLPQTSSGALQLVQCIGVGLNTAPNSGSHLHTAAIQVHGLSGQVSVFQQ